MMKKIIMYTSKYCPYGINAEKLLVSESFSMDKKRFIDRDSNDLNKMIEITG